MSANLPRTASERRNETAREWATRVVEGATSVKAFVDNQTRGRMEAALVFELFRQGDDKMAEAVYAVLNERVAAEDVLQLAAPKTDTMTPGDVAANARRVMGYLRGVPAAVMANGMPESVIRANAGLSSLSDFAWKLVWAYMKRSKMVKGRKNYKPTARGEE